MKAPSRNFFQRKSRQSRMSIISQQDAMNLSDLGSILDGRDSSLDNIDKNAKKDLVTLNSPFETIVNTIQRQNTLLTSKKDYFSNQLSSLAKLNTRKGQIKKAERYYLTEKLVTEDENELRDIEKRADYKTGYLSFRKENVHEFLFSRRRQIRYFLDKLNLIFETERSETKVLKRFRHNLFDQIVG